MHVYLFFIFEHDACLSAYLFFEPAWNFFIFSLKNETI